MRITVLNGSPKGDTSVTLQYVLYLRGKFPQHEFIVFNVAQEIRQIEKKQEKFDEVVEAVRGSDGVLWAFSLYILTVHANYMRFIELLTERGAGEAFAGKYAATLSTSIRFFDHTAHSYMRAVCEDFGMKVTGFFSASMDDLLQRDTQDKLTLFLQDMLDHIENRLPVQRLTAPVCADIKPYKPGPAGGTADNGGLKALLITEHAEPGSNLLAMTARLQAAFASPVEVVDLGQARINGSCLGCIKCGYANECAYGDTDDIREIYNVKIRNADIVIFAGELKGRFLSSRFKTFLDRRFLNTHQPQMLSKQIAYVISGPLSQNQNVVEIFQAMTEYDGANLAGTVTDEFGPEGLDAALDNLAARLVNYAGKKYIRPVTFLGVAGMKIFRDETYGHLRFPFRADHLYYKKHGYYDFPQKLWKVRLQNALMALLLKVKPIREKISAEMTKYMVAPFKKVVG